MAEERTWTVHCPEGDLRKNNLTLDEADSELASHAEELPTHPRPVVYNSGGTPITLG